MYRLFQIICLFFSYYFTHCTQPYFPPQIVFTTNFGRTLLAIDEVNQRAFISFNNAMDLDNAYVFKHIPFAPSDSPQNKYYTQLLVDRSKPDCSYESFWEYGTMQYSAFPAHWGNATTFHVGTFLQFEYEMIHSTNSSDTEDYWYANKACEVSTGQIYPCEEIYFKKNTDIPLRYTYMGRGRWGEIEQITIEYDVKSVGKPDEKYFDVDPANWSVACRDSALGINMQPQSLTIPVEQSNTVEVWLRTPPHRIHGNDTVTIGWNITYGCTDCLILTPKQLVFNIENFQKQQSISITRVKNGSTTVFNPIFYGGGFDLVPPEYFSLLIR